MTVTLALVRRNLVLYFREIGGVALSLLSAAILLGLYSLFLGKLQIDRITEQLPAAPEGDVQFFVSSWVFAGMVMIVTFTTGLGALGTFVDDRATGRFAEFRVSPIRRYQLVLGYQLAAFIVAVIMSSIILVIGTIALTVVSGQAPEVSDMLAAGWYVLLLSFVFSALSSFIMTFVKTRAGFTGVSVTVGTVLGFIAGAYLPIGTLSDGIGTALNSMPFSPAAMLLREPLAGSALNTLADGNEKVRDVLAEFYGFTLDLGDLTLSPWLVQAALLLIAVAFTILASLRIGRSFQNRV
ncbi:ABC transporter permease [Corynebacterium sp. S7]